MQLGALRVGGDVSGGQSICRRRLRPELPMHVSTLRHQGGCLGLNLGTGAACEQNTQCNSVLCGSAGTCLGLNLADGTGCEQDAQCTSGSCQGSKCHEDRTTGAACTGNSQCSSNVCYNSKCRDGNLAVGVACLTGVQCVSLTCTNGFCVTLAPGTACTANPQCASGVCTGGACAKSGVNGPCVGPGDCASGLCNNNVCLGTGLPAGSTCTLGTQCASGVCTGGACAKSDVNGPCVGPGDCVSGLCNNNVCLGTGLPAGSTCTLGTQCATGACTEVPASHHQPGGSAAAIWIAQPAHARTAPARRRALTDLVVGIPTVRPASATTIFALALVYPRTHPVLSGRSVPLASVRAAFASSPGYGGLRRQFRLHDRHPATATSVSRRRRPGHALPATIARAAAASAESAPGTAPVILAAI